MKYVERQFAHGHKVVRRSDTFKPVRNSRSKRNGETEPEPVISVQTNVANVTPKRIRPRSTTPVEHFNISIEKKSIENKTIFDT